MDPSREELRLLLRRYTTEPLLNPDPYDEQDYLNSPKAIKDLHHSHLRIQARLVIIEADKEELEQKQKKLEDEKRDLQVEIEKLRRKKDIEIMGLKKDLANATHNSRWLVALSITGLGLGGVGTNFLTTGVSTAPTIDALSISGAVMLAFATGAEILVFRLRAKESQQ